MAAIRNKNHLSVIKLQTVNLLSVMWRTESTVAESYKSNIRVFRCHEIKLSAVNSRAAFSFCRGRRCADLLLFSSSSVDPLSSGSSLGGCCVVGTDRRRIKNAVAHSVRKLQSVVGVIVARLETGFIRLSLTTLERSSLVGRAFHERLARRRPDCCAADRR